MQVEDKNIRPGGFGRWRERELKAIFSEIKHIDRLIFRSNNKLQLRPLFSTVPQYVYVERSNKRRLQVPQTVNSNDSLLLSTARLRS